MCTNEILKNTNEVKVPELEKEVQNLEAGAARGEHQAHRCIKKSGE